jgi:hypothetical protein
VCLLSTIWRQFPGTGFSLPGRHASIPNLLAGSVSAAGYGG